MGLQRSTDFQLGSCLAILKRSQSAALRLTRARVLVCRGAGAPETVKEVS